MGRKKEQAGAAEDPNAIDQPGSAHKKHKKHKKKHKRRKGDAEYDSSGEMEAGPSVSQPLHTEMETSSPKAPIKIKLIINKTLQAKGESAVRCLPSEDPVVNVTDDAWDGEKASGSSAKKGTTEDKTQESSDDEWLDALERGDLDDYGEIKRNKDPSLLTSRQRALKHGIKDIELLQLPSGYKSVELTEEQLQRRQQRAKKRREQAQEKREKDKKQTMERLLKKQETKSKGARGRSSKRANQPHVRYLDNGEGCSISLPTGMEFPLQAQGPPKPPQPSTKCGVVGCFNDKKYNCSKTKVPLCSLECYKKNLIVHGLKAPSATT